MRLYKLASVLSLACGLIAAGCTSTPARWSKDLVFELQCGMSVKEVEQRTGRELVDRSSSGSVRDPRGTHTSESDDHRTIVWFTFSSDKLRGFRVTWSEAVIGFGFPKNTSFISLCEER
jgi:hypothetical protein